MGIHWKELQLSDRDVIERYYEREPVRNCEFTFANNYLWKPYYPIFFGIVEDSLVFESGEAGMSVSFPQGAADLRGAVDALTEWFCQVGRPFQMHLVSPEQFAKLEGLYPGRFQIEYDRDFADYVYDREKLKNLSGKSMHGKKNHCNRFKKEHPDWKYERISEVNVEECLKMAEEWWKKNDFGEGGEKKEPGASGAERRTPSGGRPGGGLFHRRAMRPGYVRGSFRKGVRGCARGLFHDQSAVCGT